MIVAGQRCQGVRVVQGMFSGPPAVFEQSRDLRLFSGLGAPMIGVGTKTASNRVILTIKGGSFRGKSADLTIEW